MRRSGMKGWQAGCLVLLAACSRSPAVDLAKQAAPDVPPEVVAGISDFVDPRIGSFPPGFTNPGPTLPFGMTEVGPDTEGPLNYGGYSVQNLLISGFSAIHMSAGVYKGGQF